MVWGGRWEGGSEWGTRVHPWRMHGREKRKEIIFNEVIIENFPNLIENIHPRSLINFEQGKQKKFPTLRHSTVAP